MANGKIRFGKQSGGQLALVIPDGVTNTEVVVPKSGILATEDYVDNNSDIGAITSYSQISGTNTIEGGESTNSIHNVFNDGSAVATYQLNDNANDLGGTYNGTATNVTYEEGKFGQAGKFNGINSYINGFNFSNMNTATISTWIKPSTLGSLHCIYGQSNSGGNDVTLGVSLFISATKIRIYHNNSTYKDFSYTFTPGTYYHIVHKIEGTIVTIYINNILIGGHDFGVNRLAFNSSTFAFGRWGAYSAYYFNGLIDQVRIFNRALTEAEISTLYSETRFSSNSTLNINQGIFIYSKGLTSKGYAKSSDTFTGSVPTSGVSDGWKYVAKDENNNFSFYDTKPTLGKKLTNLYFEDGKLWSQEIGALISDGSTNTNITKITPNMSSNSQDDYIVSASTTYNANYQAYKAFDGKDDDYWWETSGATTGWLQVKLPTAKVINKYKLLPPKAYTNKAPTSWTIQASNTGTFSGEQVTLDTRTDISGWVNSTYKEFTFNNGTPYLYYKIVVTSTGGGQLGIAEMFYTEAQYANSSNPIEITPISFLSNKVRFASGIPVELAPSGIAKSVTDSFETARFELGQTWQDVTASRSAGVTYTNNTGKAIEVLINIVGSNTTFSIDNLTTDSVASNSNYATVTATIPVGSTYRISSGIQKWFELR